MRRFRRRMVAVVVVAVVAAAWALAGHVPPEARWWAGLAGVLHTAPAVGPPAVQAAVIGAWVVDQAEAHGAECRVLDGLTVCVGAPHWMYRKAGTTWGDTFVAAYPTFAALWRIRTPYTTSQLLAHETYHRDHQWRVYGAEFAWLYLAEEAAARIEGRPNRYEVDADIHGGHTGYAPDGVDSRSPPGVVGVTRRAHLVSTRDTLTR